MTTGAKFCESCERPAQTFACGPYFQGREPRNQNAGSRFYFCFPCLNREQRLAYARNRCEESGHRAEECQPGNHTAFYGRA